MKKILILAYDFPPYVSVGGLRPYNWYKYFREFGVEPIVISRQWSNTYGNGLDYIAPSETKELIIEQTEFGTIYRTPFKPNLSNRLLMKYGENRFRLLRKSISVYYEIAQFLYACGPKKEIYKSAKCYLKENKVDAIIASGDPFVLFHYASQLGRDFSTPWIADYRDPWSQNKEYQLNKLFAWWNRLQEKRSVQHASSIITVSDLLKIKIQRLIQHVPIHILPNGYDPSVIDSIAAIEQGDDSLQLAFVGTIYAWHPWKSVLLEFQQFVEEHPTARIKVNFYGINIADELENFIATELPSIKDSITITPRIPNADLLEKLAENNVMLLFNYYSFMGTKIFDYLGIRRKIVMCYGNDPEALKLKEQFYTIEEIEGISKQLQTDLIRDTNAGIVVNHASEMQNVLNELWREFESTGKIECPSHGIENYSRKIQVKHLATIIQSI